VFLTLPYLMCFVLVDMLVNYVHSSVGGSTFFVALNAADVLRLVESGFLRLVLGDDKRTCS
jgi:hypothetical protein